MTLETISRIEEALDIDIVESALSIVDGYSPKERENCYLSDVEQAQYGEKKPK